MAIGDTTYHSLGRDQVPLSPVHISAVAPVRGLQVGDSEQLNTNLPANALGSVQTEDVVASIVPDGDMRVMVTESASPTITVANSRKLIPNQPNDVFVPNGSRLFVGVPT